MREKPRLYWHLAKEQPMSEYKKRKIVDAAVTIPIYFFLIYVYGWGAAIAAVLLGAWNYYDGLTRIGLQKDEEL